MRSDLRNWARQQGLGRLAYRWIHRPRHSIDLARQFGWGLAWRAWRGASQMKRASQQLPVLATAGGGKMAAPICFLSGARFVHQTLFCAHSFVTRSGVNPDFEVLSDGSLTERHAADLRRVFPEIVVRHKAELDASVASALPPEAFPNLHDVRKNFVLLRKLTDAMCGKIGYRLFFDSDMLFWGAPMEILERAASGSPLYLADTGDDGYTATRAELNRKFGIPVAAGVNSGLVGLFAEQIDWELMERVCAFLRHAPGDQRLLEQTLWAVALGAANASPLDKGFYRLVIDPSQLAAIPTQTPAPILIHYAWNARLPYAAAEWRRYFNEVGSATNDGASVPA